MFKRKIVNIDSMSRKFIDLSAKIFIKFNPYRDDYSAYIKHYDAVKFNGIVVKDSTNTHFTTYGIAHPDAKIYLIVNFSSRQSIYYVVDIDLTQYWCTKCHIFRGGPPIIYRLIKKNKGISIIEREMIKTLINKLREEDIFLKLINKFV